MKKLVIGIALIMALVFISFSCAPAKPSTLSFAATDIKGEAYVVGTAFSKVIGKYTGIKVLVEETPGILYWGPLMKTGEMDMGFTNVADATQAYYGVKKYFNDRVPLRCIGHGSASPILFWSTNPKINSIADLRGKKVGWVVGTMSHDMSLTPLFKAYGMTVGKDVELVGYPSAGQVQSAFKEGKIEVMYWAVAPWVMEFQKTVPGFHPIPIPAEKVREINVPGLPAFSWRKGLYDNPQDVPGVGIIFAIWARSNLDEGTIYEITKAIYDHYNEYKDVHPNLPLWTVENAVRLDPMAVPFHPGAIKYYKEKGVWTAEHEKRQKEILAK